MAKKSLDDAFDTMRRGLGLTAWGTLLGEIGDEKGFRQVYPFSPALVEALVAMSHYLQRDCTALKILVEMLVGHTPVFRSLTASRLVQLNHGTLKSPVPGADATLAAQRARSASRPSRADALQFARACAGRMRLSKFQPCLPEGLLDEYFADAVDHEGAARAAADAVRD